MKEKQVDYTDCESINPDHKLPTGGSKKCSTLIKQEDFKGTCICEILVELTEAFPNNVSINFPSMLFILMFLIVFLLVKP